MHGGTGDEEGREGGTGKKRRGRNGGEERDERGGATARRGEPETRSAGGGGRFWGSMDATPRGTTLSWILRSKPATA